MTMGTAYIILAVIWIVASLTGGALLALIAKRAHPALSTRKLWIFYSALLAFAVGAIFAIALL